MADQGFTFKFEGRQGVYDVGWQNASWYDYKNMHIPIDHLDGGPVNWVVWEAEGDSYYADGKEWNKFASPEQIYRWADFLPPEEHALYLNDAGQTYNWFQGGRPFHSRLARPTMLKKGSIELSFEFYADWYSWDGKKRPLNEVGDPTSARVEMHIIDTGLDEQLGWGTDEGWNRRHQETLKNVLKTLPGPHNDWFVVNPTIGPTKFTKTFNVPRDGLFLVVFGAMSVWAVPGSGGRNGLWAKVLTAKPVGTAPTTTPGIRSATPAERTILVTPSTPEPTPASSSAPASTRGKPRVQYRRVYKLVHNSVDENTALNIFRQARATGQTVGFSADDAGIGDLNEKIVEVYGWPATDQQELVDFYNQYYPGTQVQFK
ncbi:MAG: hypothetical protein KDE51_23340 [Anaerolineales bacterium]|nr:hypothetical protein [Anaerolineales bacterium]